MKNHVSLVLASLAAAIASCADSDDTAVGISEDRSSSHRFLAPETLSFEEASNFRGFGAALDADGTTLAVGNPTEIVCREGEGCAPNGALRIYERRGNAWALAQRLSAVREGRDDFGSVVALKGDVLAVSAPSYQSCEATEPTCQNHGRVVVFERKGNVFSQTAVLRAHDAMPFQVFGGSLAIHGSQILVGAAGDGVCGAESADVECVDTGAVYVFERTVEGGFTEVQKLKPRKAGRGESVGFSVAVDGDTLVAGAPGHVGCLSGVGEIAPFDLCRTAGAVYVFERRGGAWEERDVVLFRKDVLPTFNGRSVRLSGNVLAVAGMMGGHCPGLDASSCVRKGIVLTYEKHSDGWRESGIVQSEFDGLVYFANAFDLRGGDLAVAVRHRPSGSSDDHESIELFHRARAEWRRVASLTAQPVPFSNPMHLLDVRLESVGVLATTPSAPGCNTPDPFCRTRGTVVTWPSP
jgi:hypothetical protein